MEDQTTPSATLSSQQPGTRLRLLFGVGAFSMILSLGFSYLAMQLDSTLFARPDDAKLFAEAKQDWPRFLLSNSVLVPLSETVRIFLLPFAGAALVAYFFRRLSKLVAAVGAFTAVCCFAHAHTGLGSFYTFTVTLNGCIYASMFAIPLWCGRDVDSNKTTVRLVLEWLVLPFFFSFLLHAGHNFIACLKYVSAEGIKSWAIAAVTGIKI